MKNSKISVSGGGLPPSIASLPLAWDWRFLRIDDKSLSEFAKHIHWIIQCEPDQAEKDALNLLRELVDKARSEWKLTRVELKQAVYAQRFQYYKSVAQLIVDHPQVSLEELRRKHGLSVSRGRDHRLIRNRLPLPICRGVLGAPEIREAVGSYSPPTAAASNRAFLRTVDAKTKTQRD